jgi:hypothetical protein
MRLARGVWGSDDQIGMLNHVDEHAAREAAKLVIRGKRFNLNLPVDEPLGSIGSGAHHLRTPPKHTFFKRSGLYHVCDDKLDDFYLQGSTQWDGLTHIGDPVRGFYNGVTTEEINQTQTTRNGIEKFCAHGIATRGVLADLPRFFESVGRPWSSVGSAAASASELSACLRQQDTELRPGDVLLVRTGWTADFRAASTLERRDRLFREKDYSGLSGDESMCAFLWDSRLAAVASDSVTVEQWPVQPGKPSLHLAIARLGMVLGELFDLETLADDSAATGRYDCFFVSVPMNVRGGAGSPSNAMALR